MTDTQSGGAPAPAIPSVTGMNTVSTVHLILGIGAGILATHGVIAQSDVPQYVELGAALVMAAIPVVSFAVRNFQHKAVVVAALNAPAAQPPVKP